MSHMKLYEEFTSNGKLAKKKNKSVQVVCNCCRLGEGEYSTNYGLWVKRFGMERTRAPTHLGVLRVQLQWFLEIQSPQLVHLQDGEGIPYRRMVRSYF